MCQGGASPPREETTPIFKLFSESKLKYNKKQAKKCQVI